MTSSLDVESCKTFDFVWIDQVNDFNEQYFQECIDATIRRQILKRQISN